MFGNIPIKSPERPLTCNLIFYIYMESPNVFFQFTRKKYLILVITYGLVNVLSSFSEIFERIILRQISCHVNDSFLCGNRQGFRSQYAFISFIKMCKMSLDKKEYGGAVLIDVSKMFDTIKHELSNANCMLTVSSKMP